MKNNYIFVKSRNRGLYKTLLIVERKACGSNPAGFSLFLFLLSFIFPKTIKL